MFAPHLPFFKCKFTLFPSVLPVTDCSPNGDDNVMYSQAGKRARLTIPFEELKYNIRPLQTARPTIGVGVGLTQTQSDTCNISQASRIETLMTLQIMAALFENFPPGAEKWLLDFDGQKDGEEALAEIVDLLSSVLETRCVYV